LEQLTGYRDRQFFVEEMFKQFQTKFEQAQVTAANPMDTLDPTVAYGCTHQIDDLDVGQASGYRQVRETSGIRKWLLYKLDAPAFLVREEGLNPEALFVPVAGFFHQFEIGDQENGFLVLAIPPSNRQDKAIGGLSEMGIGDFQTFAGLHLQTLVRVPLLVHFLEHVFGCPIHIHLIRRFQDSLARILELLGMSLDVYTRLAEN